MKVTTFTFLKHKPNQLLFTAIMLAGFLFSAPKAYSQVDYYYGINNKGFRVGVGVGAAQLRSNWNKNAVEPVGTVSVDYDFNQFVGVGIQGQFGLLQGIDDLQKFSYQKSKVNFANGNLNFHVAVGQFLNHKNPPKNLLIDALQRIYLGVGIGEVHSEASLYYRYDGAVVYNPYSATIQKNMTSTDGGKAVKGSGTFAVIPVSLGTRIPLRGFLGNDKIDLIPLFQYNFVSSPVFDGYQPSTIDDGAYIKKNGNQGYSTLTLSIRYKF